MVPRFHFLEGKMAPVFFVQCDFFFRSIGDESIVGAPLNNVPRHHCFRREVGVKFFSCILQRNVGTIVHS